MDNRIFVSLTLSLSLSHSLSFSHIFYLSPHTHTLALSFCHPFYLSHTFSMSLIVFLSYIISAFPSPFLWLSDTLWGSINYHQQTFNAEEGKTIQSRWPINISWFLKDAFNLDNFSASSTSCLFASTQRGKSAVLNMWYYLLKVNIFRWSTNIFEYARSSQNNF